MTRFGIDFDYKMANRYAWLYCIGIILAISILLGITFHKLMSNYVGGMSPFNTFLFFSTSLHQNQILIAPLLTYIYMMRSLQTRFAVLNQLLRYACDWFFIEFLVLKIKISLLFYIQKTPFRWK